MNFGIMYLMWDMVKRDFRSKYAGSTFGLLWNLLMPIAYIVIYTTVFSQLMSAKLPSISNTYAYSIYLSSGILAWTVFNVTITRFQNIFIDNANIVKKVYFPKSILLYSTALSSIIELIINYGLLLIVLLILGYPVHLSYILIVFIIIFQQLFCLGIGFALSVFTVHFRDMSQLLSIALPIWFWLTPIVYVIDILPDGFKNLIVYNPLYYYISSLQSLILNGEIINMLLMTMISFVTLLLGIYIYKKNIDEVSDLI